MYAQYTCSSTERMWFIGVSHKNGKNKQFKLYISTISLLLLIRVWCVLYTKSDNMLKLFYINVIQLFYLHIQNCVHM